MTWDDLISVIKGLQAGRDKVEIESENGEAIAITGIEATKEKVVLKVVVLS